MAFNGKLIELYTSGTYVEFPLKYVKLESYKVTPDQRMEQSVERSVSGVLQRTTCSHTVSKIEIDTVTLTNTDVSAIHTLFSNAYTNALERKLGIKFYDPVTDAYKTATVYIPDIDYNIHKVDLGSNTILYNSLHISFIEY